MSYPQINTYPLTLGTAGNYTESLKTVTTAFTPRQSVFFMPMAWMRVGNIQYRPEQLVTAFSESTPLFCGITKKVTKMTTLSETYDAYVKLRQILKNYTSSSYDMETDEGLSAVCAALNSLETAIAYIPMEDKSDRKIKLEILKKTITDIAEDNDGRIDLDKLPPRSREQLTMVLQLMGE